MNNIEEKECPYCHKKFIGDSKYCSPQCGNFSKRKKVEPKYCETCGELLDPSLFTGKEYETARFCNRKCSTGRLRLGRDDLSIMKSDEYNTWSTDNGVVIKVFHTNEGWIWKAYKKDKFILQSVGNFPEKRDIIRDMGEAFG